MHEYQKMVNEFHEKFGLVINTSPTIPSEKDQALRVNLIAEEAGELLEYITSNIDSEEPAVVGVADACGDLLYVIYGAAITYGLELSSSSIKVAEWHDPTTNLRNFPDRSLPKLCRYILHSISQFSDASLKKDLKAILLILNDLVANTNFVAETCGIKIDPIFKEIQRSNMTKVWPDGTVKRRESDGKILKPPTYSSADLVSILVKQNSGKAVC